MTNREEEGLVQRVMDGDATQEDIVAFQIGFHDDAEFRQRYYDHVMLFTHSRQLKA